MRRGKELLIIGVSIRLSPNSVNVLKAFTYILLVNSDPRQPLRAIYQRIKEACMI